MELKDYCSDRKSPLKMVLGSFPGIMINNYTFRETYNDSNKICKVALDFGSYFKLDFLRTVTDLVFESEILGSSTIFPKMSHPKVIKPVISCSKDISKLSYNLDNNHRFFTYQEAYRLLKEQTNTPVIASITGPFTILSSITSQEYFNHIFRNRDTENIMKIINIITCLSLDLVEHLNKVRPHCLMISDPVASFLSSRDFRELLAPSLNRIFSLFKGMTVFHICGDVESNLKDIFDLYAQGISIDESVDIIQALKTAPKNKVVLGNISPIETMVKGTPEHVESESKELITLWSEYKNFIPATGCTIPYNTPLANIKAFLEA